MNGNCCDLVPLLRQLDLSYNQLSGSVDNELFNFPLESVDFSHNQLSGELPSGNVPGSQWEIIRFHGNPLMRGTLPTWVQISTSSLLKEAGTRFICPSLGSKARENAILTLDASYYDYDSSLCRCDAGTYGTPPNCADIPSIGQTPTIANISISQSGTFNWSTLNDAYEGITNERYGSSRLISGMDTSWLINSTDLLLSTRAYDPLNRPVLAIVITIQFTALFSESATNSLSVYDGSTDLQGTRVAFFVGSGNTSLAFVETVTVLDHLATINFKSRSSSGKHFKASFVFAYTCPSGYIVSPTLLPAQCVVYAPLVVKNRDFQRILGVLTLLWQLLSVMVASCLLIYRRTERSIGLQSPWLLATTTLGSLFVVDIPIMGIMGITSMADNSGTGNTTTMFCGLSYWLGLLWQPLLMTPLLMIILRLYIAATIQAVRKSLAEKMDVDKNNRLVLMGRLVMPRNQVLMATCMLFPPVAFAFASAASVGVNDCRPDTRTDVIQLLYFVVYETLLLVCVSKIHNERDAFGLSARIGRFVLYYSLLSLVYHVLKFAAPTLFMDPFDYRYLQWLVCALYQGLGIISPVLATMPMFQTPVDNTKIEPLDEMLATRLGYAYMYAHCSSEFSAENIMCWRAIEDFKRKTTVDEWRAIVDKYIGNAALLQVNIPAAKQRNVLTMVPTIHNVCRGMRESVCVCVS